jgi:hypothetical protein
VLFKHKGRHSNQKSEKEKDNAILAKGFNQLREKRLLNLLKAERKQFLEFLLFFFAVFLTITGDASLQGVLLRSSSFALPVLVCAAMHH